MRTKILMFFMLIWLPCLGMAAGSTGTMAAILVDLNHFPSAENKAALAEIAANSKSSYNEKLVAKIISRIEHKVSDEDRESLEELLDDPDTSPDLQVIAKAILGINHKVSDGDAKALKKLMK